MNRKVIVRIRYFSMAVLLLQPKELRFSDQAVSHWHYQTAWKNVTKSFGTEIYGDIKRRDHQHGQTHQVSKPNEDKLPLLGKLLFGEKNLYGSEKNGSLVCHIQSSTMISPTSKHPSVDVFTWTSIFRSINNDLTHSENLIRNGIDVPLSVEKK